ncbi:hypothetical protein J7K86_01745 [bacterium]|nr:hypothetical protein [bacterium]
MKKFLVLFLVFFGFVAFASTSNLEKAKQEAVSKRERILEQQKQKIENLTTEITKDGVATGKEMKALVEEIGRFKELKRKFDKELRIYGVQTETVLNENYHQIRKKYRKEHLTWLRDSNDKVKLAFANLTGKDVEVRGTVYFPLLIFSLFYIFFGLLCFVMSVVEREKMEVVIFVGLVFIVCGLVFLLA